MSEMLKEMSEVLLSDPHTPPTSEATHVALLFANVAWNEGVGLDHAREGYRNVWEEIEADNPTLWNEFKSNDIDGMIDELVEYKQKHFPDDKRRILTCGIPHDRIRVEWLNACCSRRRSQMGNAAFRTRANRRTTEGDPVSPRDSAIVPLGGNKASGEGRL